MSATTIQSRPNSQATKGASPKSSIALRAGGEGEGELKYLPLSCLRVDELNVRTVEDNEPTEAEIEELADLIDAQGLLQNLIVVAYATPMAGKGKDKKRLFTHGVVAGGRRLRALWLLVKRGRITLDEEFLCLEVPRERALVVSASENSGRKEMSVADTVTAFADMVRAGAGIEELAVCFHLSPLTVQRRLRLANVSPSLFALFRNEEMKLEQLMALALSDDHATQEAAWEAAPAHDRSARRLRALIAGEGVSKAVQRFVGLQAYAEAGGRMLRDLFANVDDESAVSIQDPTLMERLATQKLQTVAEQVRSEGGSAWVETFTEFGYGEREGFAAAPSSQRPATAQEAAKLEQLKARERELSAQIDAEYEREYDESEEDSDDERDVDEGAAQDSGAGPSALERLEADLEAVQGQIGALNIQMAVVSPEVAKLVGAVVYLTHEGEVRIERNRLHKSDLAAARRAALGASGGGTGMAQGENAGDDAAVARGGISERLCKQLTAQRTRALQACLLGNQSVALAALLHPLVVRVVYDGGIASYESPSAIKANAQDCDAELKTWAPDLAESRAEQVVQDALKQARELLPVEAGDLLPWLLKQSQDTLLQLLTLCAALSLNSISGSGKPGASAPLAEAVGLDMRQWWTPTKESYLGAVSKALLAQAVEQAGLPEDANALAKLKKAEAVSKAEQLLADKGWLPTVLRRSADAKEEEAAAA